jgi:hypothetical protein
LAQTARKKNRRAPHRIRLGFFDRAHGVVRLRASDRFGGELAHVAGLGSRNHQHGFPLRLRASLDRHLAPARPGDDDGSLMILKPEA